MPSLAQPAFATDAALPVRRIAVSDLRWALDEGWKDFREKRGDLLFAGLLYPLIGLITAAVVLSDQLMPMFFPLVAGLSILGPAAASGFYELARRREAGLDAGWSHFLDPVRGRRRAGLFGLIILSVGLFVVWLAIAWAIYAATLGRLAPVGYEAFFAALFGTAEGWAMILLGNLAGLALAAATLALTVVSYPMVVDRPVDAFTALRTSLDAFRANRGVLARWGLWVAGLLFLGALPAFIGLAVVLPWLGYATWHLYTRLVERGPAQADRPS